ncbi:MAG: putative phage abortive infection protein [Methylococcaceae bacterium]
MQVTFKWFVLGLIVFAMIVAVLVKKSVSLRIVETITPTKLAEYFLWMIVIVFLFIAGIFGRYVTHFNGDLSTDQAKWGTFGDYIGGTLNPILSFISLIALLTTIVLQSKEFELTRDELKRNASAQEETKKILDKQSETLARQQFESTFFSMLDQHNKLLESLNVTYANNRSETKLNYIMSSVFNSHTLDLSAAKMALELNNHICGHYFRVLYQLLKFIATNSPDSLIGNSFDTDKIENEKVSYNEKMYSNIVRSFLGYQITQLLAINCYCKEENDTYWRFKLLIERYAFFEHMPFEVNLKEIYLLRKTEKVYKKSAFGNSDFVKNP